jgi:peptide deformylase
MKLALTLHPTRSLNQPSKPVTHFDAALAELAIAMNETMIRENGIGLAAPQIGKNIQLIIVKVGDEGSNYKTYVNPRITFASAKTIAIEEGCLSVPGVFGYVSRRAKIRVSYHDLTGIKHIEKATGMRAIVLQHEIDHINGTLIIDHPMHITKGSAIKNRPR